MSDKTTFVAEDNTAPKQTVDSVEKETNSDNVEIKASTVNVCNADVVDDKHYTVEKI